jgi:hypothetical protein
MRASSVRATAHAIVTIDEEPNQQVPFQTTPDEGVRKPPIRLEAVSAPDRVDRRPAHPSNRLVAQLNEGWRVVDDPLQRILQRKKGNSRRKNSGWRGRSFCRTRDALLRCVAGFCGEIDDNALAELKSLPDWHPDWDSRDQRKNLDVLGTDQVQADAQSDPLVSQGLDGSEADNQRPLAADPLSIRFVVLSWGTISCREKDQQRCRICPHHVGVRRQSPGSSVAEASASACTKPRT